jgi:hypothetical protein
MSRRYAPWAVLLPLTLALSASAQSPPPQARLLDALQRNRLPLTISGARQTGAAWEWLVHEARDARFTLIGEAHRVAETAQRRARPRVSRKGESIEYPRFASWRM